MKVDLKIDATDKLPTVKKSEINFEAAFQVDEENYARTKPPMRVSIRIKNESQSPRT